MTGNAGRVALYPENIPAELKERDCWVTWRYEVRDGDETKVPYRANRSGHRASSTDSSTWATFDEAIGAYVRDETLSGIGFVLSDNDPFAGIDLDHVRDPETGHIEPWAEELVFQANSYSEVSPSQTGLRIFVRGELPEGRRKKGHVEMYSNGRYLTVTGSHLPGTPLAVEERTGELAAIHRRVFGDADAKPSNDLPSVVSDAGPLTDADVALIARAKTANDGGKFSKLWTGEWAELGYPSQSEADQALANKLAFWTGKDAGRIDRLFRNSGLMRAKWDRDHFSAEPREYGKHTIARAIDKQDDTYTPRSDEGLDLGWLRADGTHAPQARRRFTIMSLPEFLDRPRPTFLVDDLLVRGTLAGLVGAYASYKSFHALDLAMSVASGAPWLGRETEQAPTLYISGEGSGGLTDRIRAWSAHRRQPFPACFHMLPDAVQFMAPGDVEALLDEIGRFPKAPGLVVVDTVARCMVGGDENSAKDMGLFVSGVDRLREATGATVVLIHHVTKSTGTVRGSTALPGALDTMIEVRGDGDLAELTCGKQKDCASFDPIRLRRNVVEVAPGVSSLVFDVATGPTPADSWLTGSAPRVLQALREGFGSEGATSSRWAAVCAEQAISNSTFFRAVKSLEEAGQVARRGSGRGSRFTAITPTGLS